MHKGINSLMQIAKKSLTVFSVIVSRGNGSEQYWLLIIIKKLKKFILRVQSRIKSNNILGVVQRHFVLEMNQSKN